ncbi:MAG: hypothetical protein M1836_007706 [Candelina mexicana]|nr:MAG: hypothetical protein M1836_007706 [Candelina mexicana]
MKPGIILCISLPLIAALPSSPLITRQSSIRNDLSGNSPCKPYTLIYARGTGEAGNIGGATANSFISALASQVGDSNLAVQGVDYPAVWADALQGGSQAGATTMAQLVELAASKCANGTKIVMSGYSQGGFLVHNAAKQLSSAAAAMVSSVVIFADPLPGQPVGSIPSYKVYSICNQGDNVCQPQLGDWKKGIAAVHGNYGIRGAEAATFVVGDRHLI